MRGRIGRHLAATVLVAAGGSVLASPPASAATCSTATGVSVVVDYHELGSGVQEVCDSGGGGKYASTLFGESGFTLSRVQREQGFVCRVDGLPGSDRESCVNTPPSDAYWGLWWSNGTSGTWTFASAGVDSLKIPAGGSVAFSWNGSSTKSPPRSTPPTHAASSSPSPSPSPSSSPASSGGSGSGTTGGGGTGGTSGGTGGTGTSGGTTGAGGGTTATGATTGSGSTDRSGATGTAPGASGTPDARATRTARAARVQHRQHRQHLERQADRAQAKATAQARRERRHQASASASPGASSAATSGPSAGPGTSVSSDPPGVGGRALPVWLAPAGIATLFAAALATWLVRRRRGISPP